ncbi:AraC family transcriptional regulator [Natronincola peptidivorans]|uniref:AraC family transcriptional regulator n=1 Tax=Natronincola peptidivorans TaxID=426128 RepID=A0A1I0DDV7_9FIRM|nr:effector binding domain-containing protein [Natronincola peptidivorans]SET30516.1 AraC family transcriptional regulator [Natronincola peptidivorans]
MEIINRDELMICGYVVETSVDNCSTELGRLWDDYRNNKSDELLEAKYRCKEGLYGLMWYTENHRYCYLLGREIKSTGVELPKSKAIKKIPPARYAVYTVPNNMSVFDAWTVFFEEEIPKEGYEPNAEIGLYFEYYTDKDSNSCQLWAPIR